MTVEVEMRSEGKGAWSDDLMAVVTVAAVLNVALGLAVSTHGQGRPLAFFANLSLTWVVLLALAGLLWLVLGWPLQRLSKTSGLGRTTAILALLPIAILAPLARPVQTGEQDWVKLPLYLAIAMSAIAVVLAGRAIAQKAGLEPFLPPALRIASVFFLPAALLVYWALSLQVEVIDDESGLPSLAAILLVASLLGLGILMGLLLRRSESRGWYRPAQWFLIGVLVLAPLVVGGIGRLVAQPTATVSAGRPRPEHVVLITVDTLRADELVSRGADRAPIPQIDSLMHRSSVFVNARTPSPWTRPAVASIMTGLSPSVHATISRESRLPDEVRTLAEELADAGFRTAAIGRNGAIGHGLNFDQGFMEFDFYLTNEAAATPSFGMDLLRRLGFERVAPSTSELADLAVDWIRRHAKESFFLWVHFLDPHGPYAPPDAYKPEPTPGVRYADRFGQVDAIRGGYLVPTEDEWARIRALYRGEISYVDDGVGRILDALQEQGIFDQATIVLTSDHGEEFREHGSAGHGHSLFDEVLRVPLMIKFPEQTEGRTVMEDVTIESVTPTILSIVGASPGDYPFQAEVLDWAAQQSSSDRARPPIVSTGLLYYDDRFSVVFKGKKYIESIGDGLGQLYDLESDPREQTPLGPERADEAAAMRQLLLQHREQSLAISAALGLEGGEVVEPSEELLRELKALGYIQ